MKRTIQWVVLATSTAGAALLALGASACAHDAQATAELECQIICGCASTADQAVCNAQCPSAASSFSPSCQDCILQNSNSCSQLEAVCRTECNDNGSGSNQPGGSGSGSGSGSSGSAAITDACDLVCSCEGSGAPVNCTSDCASQISSTCASCLNSDGTCNAVTNCQSSCP